MADGVAITAGSGTTILTDDTGAGGHAQVVKLAIATDGSATLIPADGTDGLLVNLGANNDVSVTSIVPGTGATNLGKAEDAAHTSGDVGVMSLAVRSDSLGAIAGTSGDYTPLQVDPDGALYVAPISPVGTEDVFGRRISVAPELTIDVQFFRGAPSALLNVATANSATAASNVGGALFSSSTNTNGSVQGVTKSQTVYRSGSEVFCMFTAAFTAGIADSYMRIGLYDANNGFFIGYEGTSFGVTTRSNAADVTVFKASWSEDTLTGAAGSRFTRAGVPEAIDLTKLNVFRLRFGWLGSAPAIWEVMAPDGHWVQFHKTLFPNLQAAPSIRSADLPMTLDITKSGAAATDLTIQTDCWGAGTTSAGGAHGDIYAFQTTTALGAGASYESRVVTLNPLYSQVQTCLTASHDGTLYAYWYSDAAGTDLVRTLTIPYTTASGFQLFSTAALTPYAKWKFTNDAGSTQSDFYFDTKLLTRPISPQLLRVDGTVLGGMIATVSRSVISGETTGGGGGYVNVKVNPSGTLAASADVTAVIPGTGATNLGKAIDVAAGASDVGVATLAVRDDALSALTPIEGDYVPLRTDANGALWVIPSGTTAVSGTVTANLAAGTNNIGDVDVLSLPALAAGTNNIGDVDVLTVPADPFGANADAASATGSISAKLRQIAANGIPITSLPASTNTIEVVGDIAHDTGVSGNPVQVAGAAVAMADSAPGNRVSAAADVTRLATSLDGGVFVHPHGPQIWSYHENSSSQLTDTTVKAAPAAGLSHYITDIIISTGAATAFNVFFEEGASTVLGPFYLEAVSGRGLHIKFGTPKKITAATALTVTTSAAIAHSIDVTGFTAPG